MSYYPQVKRNSSNPHSRLPILAASGREKLPRTPLNKLEFSCESMAPLVELAIVTDPRIV